MNMQICINVYIGFLKKQSGICFLQFPLNMCAYKLPDLIFVCIFLILPPIRSRGLFVLAFLRLYADEFGNVF